DGIRDYKVTGVQTCALPIYARQALLPQPVVPNPLLPVHAHDAVAVNSHRHHALRPNDWLQTFARAYRRLRARSRGVDLDRALRRSLSREQWRFGMGR